MKKREIEYLSILGGKPAFSEALHVGRPNIGDRQRLMERFNRVLDRRWLTNNGPFVQEFELRIQEFLGVKHCIALCNATVALEIAYRALGLHGEVILPSFTFIATAHALQWQEINPVFCDVKPETHNIDPAIVERMITPRTSGIVGVHLWGRACDIEALTEIALKRNLKLIFDASHALGCSHHGKMIGNFGNAEVISFHATKFINTFEGGAILTNDDKLASKIRLMKNFGFAGYDNVIYIGTNGKMSEASAIMGITNMESIDEFISINYRNYQEYIRELADLPGVDLNIYKEDEQYNYQYIVLEINEDVTGISRDQMLRALHAENILARRYFYPGCHRMEPYRSYFPHSGMLLPVTERLTQRVLALPTGTNVSVDDIQVICEIIRLLVYNSEEINDKLVGK